MLQTTSHHYISVGNIEGGSTLPHINNFKMGGPNLEVFKVKFQYSCSWRDRLMFGILVWHVHHVPNRNHGRSWKERTSTFLVNFRLISLELFSTTTARISTIASPSPISGRKESKQIVFRLRRMRLRRNWRGYGGGDCWLEMRGWRRTERVVLMIHESGNW